MSERTVRMTVEYDGTEFAGWQVQPAQRTVQGELESALARILRQPIRVVAAGRTDAGVHATGQVVSCRIPGDAPLGRLAKGVNAVLPEDVVVTAIDDAPPGFNARYDARARTYRYTIALEPLAVGRRYAWKVRYGLERELLTEAARLVHGACDLRGFSSVPEDEECSSYIFSSGWEFGDRRWVYEITAARFFQHTVRSIVGTMVEIGRGAMLPEALPHILTSGNRALAGPTAPAQGLCLVYVAYQDDPDAPVLPDDAWLNRAAAAGGRTIPAHGDVSKA